MLNLLKDWHGRGEWDFASELDAAQSIIQELLALIPVTQRLLAEKLRGVIRCYLIGFYRTIND